MQAATPAVPLEWHDGEGHVAPHWTTGQAASWKEGLPEAGASGLA